MTTDQKQLAVTILSAVIACLASSVPLYAQNSKIARLTQKQTVELKAGELTMLLGNEFDHGAGKTGYIGIWSLTSIHEPRNLFFPRYAGWIHSRIRANVTRMSDREGVIQHFLADGKLWTRQIFRIVPPYYFDCIFSRQSTTGSESFSGTSYMNGPADPGISFVTPDLTWQRHYDPEHGSAASIYPDGMPLPKLTKVPNAIYKHGTNSFADSVSRWRYHPDYALFYGRFGMMVLVHMFPPRCGVIPFMSPTGGGRQPDGRKNPAWDWRGYFKGLEVKGGRSQLPMRAIYKLFVSDDDIIREYHKWVKETLQMDVTLPKLESE